MKTSNIKYLLLIFFFMVYLLIPLPYALSQVMLAPRNGIVIPIGPAGPLLPVPPLRSASFLFSQFPPFQIIGLSNRFGNSPSSNRLPVGIPSSSGGYGGVAPQGNGNPGLMGGLQMTTAPGLVDDYGFMNEYETMGGPGLMGDAGAMLGLGPMGAPNPTGGPGMVNNFMGPPITGIVTLPGAIPAPTTIVVPITLPIPVIVDTIAPPANNNVVPLPIIDTIPTPVIVNTIPPSAVIVDTIPPPVVNNVVPPPVVDIFPPSIPQAATSFPAPTIPPSAGNRMQYPMQYNYVNVGSFGIYAPTDPLNFALVNSFFPNGIFTGPQTVVTENITTVTTPIVTSTSYYPSPTPGVADLNSIQYTPASSLPLNNMIASPYVTIYGPGGILLSGPGLFN